MDRGQRAGVGNAPCVNGQASPARDCVPEPPPAAGLDYLDNVSGHLMYRLAYRNQGTQATPDESLVVSGPSAGSDANHGAVEWFEFRNPIPGSSTTTPTVFQSGTYDPDTNYRWLPSVAMDKDRNIALGYSKSSTTVKPGIYITGRLATDPVDTMGAEIEMRAGLGVQKGGGNRWGDYSAMTLDPIDQCTFYYTNEYLKTDGAFNWSTRIASYKFPSCVSAANAYGTVTGTITSAETGAPIQGVRVALSNGYAGASDANGVYTILVPAGSYSATAADANRNCTTASPASATVAPPGGGTVTQNFMMTGKSKLEANGFTINDSLGNNNGIVNKAECVLVNLGVKNNGCAKETAISGKLTTTTAGVTVVDGNSTYADKAIDESGTNATPFKISVGSSFVCGSEIALSLNLTYASGTKSLSFSVPTCAGGPDQQIPTSQLTASDPTQADRVGRNSFPSTCSGKASPGGGFPGTHPYKTFTFANTSGAPRCYTVTINAALGGPGDIESVAYDQVYDPTNVSTNYLGDTGISGLGTTVDHVSYSFTVPAQHNFVVVVNATGNTNSSPFSGTVSGFVDNTAGPGVCSGAPTPTPTPVPTPTPTPTATPAPTATPTPTATPAPTPTPQPQSDVEFTSATYDIQENGGQVVLTLNRSGDVTGEAQVHYATSDGTAKAGSDYTAQSGDVTFPDRSSSGTITIPIINDNTPESTEQFTVTLTPTASAGVGRRGTATVNIIDDDAPAPTPTATPTATPSPSPAQLLNISTRAQVLTGDNRVIGGFIIKGQQSKRVVILAKGPSLNVDGTPVPGRLSDPTLELRAENGELLKANDNWKDSPERQQIEDSGLAPKDDRESAILATLAPGVYTGIVSGKDDQTGLALVEVYDAAVEVDSILGNISTRGRVGTGDNVMIGGFIAGNNTASTKVLIRGIGPSLAGKVPDPLADPVLELHDANGATLGTNDNWKDSPDRAAIEATGIPPSNDLESAILYTVSKTGYTAVLRGNGGVGVALVEIYNVR